MNSCFNPSRFHRTALTFWVALACLVSFSGGRALADITGWSGAEAFSNPNWSNPVNWTNNTVPPNPLTFTNYNTADGTVFFDTSASGFTDSIVDTPWSIGRLVFTAASPGYVLKGADLTLAQAQSAAGNGNIDITGPATATISNRIIIPIATTTPAPLSATRFTSTGQPR